MGANSEFQKYGATVRTDRNKKIEEQIGLLLQRKKQLRIEASIEAKVINANVIELVELLNRREVSSKQLVTIYCHRAATIGMDYVLITEDNFDMAYTLAQKYDQIRRNSNKVNWTFGDIWDEQKFLPPLFGIPFSVKDNFDMIGKRTTLGLTTRAHDIKQKDCGLIVCLKQSGMIPFVRSNVSQLTMTFESTNYLWGRSINIWNKARTVGGSSGGEAGLIASRCSPLGLGTDIGGSLRIPAQFCGICSLKCSDRRFSTSIAYSTQFSKTVTGKDTFPSINGPLGRCVDDLALWMKVTSNEKYHLQKDLYTKLTPFNQKVYIQHQKQKKLKIGYFDSCVLLETTPASRRAVNQVVAFLEQQGHELVPIQIPNFKELIQQFFSQASCQGKFRSFDEQLKGQKPIPQYKKLQLISKLPSFVKIIVKMIVGKFAPRLSIFLQKTDQLSVHDYLKHVGKVQQFRQQFANMWTAMKLNHILAPGFGCQANIHGLTAEITPCAIYTFIWNTLGFAAGSIPITVVKQNEEYYETAHEDLLTDALRKNVIGSAGLPVGVQLIGAPFEEEQLLGIMRVVEENFKFSQRYKPNELQL